MVMKKIFFLFFLLQAMESMAQSSVSWDGDYAGNIIGIESTLLGKSRGKFWTGEINASGYAFTLSGTIDGLKVEGTMTDPQTQSTAPFRARLEDNTMIITIHDINPITNLEEDMDFVFSKTGTGTTVAQTLPTPPPPRDVDPSKLDQRLVGQWRYTSAYVSGDFSFATDYFMQFENNGIIYITDGRTAGGGPSSSIDSGSGDVHQNTWKTENKQIYLNDPATGWYLYAKYVVDENNLMLTYANGNKQVWERL